MEQRNTPPLGGMNTPPPGRKRPRTEKPPSNIYGDKRRRDQESSYMEQLVELIRASISNPESLNMKKDKLAPLLEKWNQMNRMKDQQPEMEQQQGSEVQHSQVSSSKPAMLSGDSLEMVLLQTLDAFLFVVNMSNNKAEIEYVSGNIQSFLNYKQEELIGQSIYNFIHVGDHNHSISCLVPNSSNAGGMWKDSPSVSRSFKCRMQIKVDNPGGGMGQETRYENMKCSAMLKPASDKDGESSSSAEGVSTSHLYVIAQRGAEENRASSSSSNSVGGVANNMIPPIEEMTIEMDVNCCITAVDVSKVKPPYHSQEEMLSQPIYKYCHSGDRTDMRKYFDEVKEKGSSSSSLYSFQLYKDTWVYIQMNSHIRKNQHTGQTEIVAVHSIIRDPELSNRLKSMASTGGQGNTTSRVLEVLSNKKSGLHASTVNQITLIMMKRQQAQKQQQQGMGMGYGGGASTSMNNGGHMNPQQVAMMGGGPVMMGGTPPPHPDRTNSFPGGMVGGGGYPPAGAMSKVVGSMNNIARTMSNVPGSMGGSIVGGMNNSAIVNSVAPSGGAMPPSLEPSTMPPQVPSSSESHMRRVPPMGGGGELGDGGDSVFLPTGIQPPTQAGQGGKAGGSKEKHRHSTGNPSPDTNEETDKEFLRKNFLLSKLLEDDETNIENIETEAQKSSLPASLTSPPLGQPKAPAKPAIPSHRKDVLDNTLLKTMLEEESIRQHQASGVAAGSKKRSEHSERNRTSSQSTLLAGMLDGDPTKMFGSGKLPKEQPGFISSTIVSTTTALRKASESGMEEARGRGSDGKEPAAKKPKKRNELLEKLLREEDECSSSDQNNSHRRQNKSDGSPTKDATTSPTVTSTKPQLPQMDQLLDEDTAILGEDENVIQQILRAANSLQDDLGANNPNLIMDLLKDFDDESGRDFVKQYLSTDAQMGVPNQRTAPGGAGPSNPQPPPNYGASAPPAAATQGRDQMFPPGINGQPQAYPSSGFGGPPMGVGNMPGGAGGGGFSGYHGDGMVPSNGPPQQMNRQMSAPHQQFGGPGASTGGRMYPQQAKNVPPGSGPSMVDKMKDKPPGGDTLPGGDDIIQQLEQVLNNSELDMNLPASSTSGPQDNFSSLWNKPTQAGPTQNIPAQGTHGGFPTGTPAVSSTGTPQSQPMVPTVASGGGPTNLPSMMDGAGGPMPAAGPSSMAPSSSMMMAHPPTRFQGPTSAVGAARPGYTPPNMAASQMGPQQQPPAMMQQHMPGHGPSGHGPTGHPTEATMARQPNQLKQAIMMKTKRWQEQQQRNMQQQQQQQQQMMQQQQMRMQQQKNLMMLQQKQQQQTFSGPQMEGQMFSGMDSQPYGPTKLTEMLSPSTNMAAPNVSIQKTNMQFGNQMANFSGHPMQPGGNMGPRPMHHGMQQYPQGSARPSPDYGPQYGQMMAQGRAMPSGYQGPQHGMPMGGYPGPEYSGGMAGPGGMNMMHSGMGGQMGGGGQHLGMTMNPSMGGNPMSTVPGMRPPGMRSGGSMGARMGTPQLNRSMSMPQSSMNHYQMQAAPQNNYGNFGGAPVGNPSMAGIRQPGMAAAMSRQASMPETMNAGNMRWNAAAGSTGNMQSPYSGGGVAAPASSMAAAAGQFGNPGGTGGMDYQNMMQQRGGQMQGHQMAHANMGNIPTSTSMNPGMQQPQAPNQQGGFPGGQGNPQHSVTTNNINPGNFPPTGVPPSSGAGGSTELEKMMNFGNMMGDFNKPGGMMATPSNTSMPPQSNVPDSSGNARRNQMKLAQNQVHKQARSRFQEFCKVSNAREAPDAKTRVTNLFRNQLLGMAPNLSQTAAGNATPTLLPTSAGTNQQRMTQENMDQNSGEGQDDGNKHSLLQKLLSST